MESARHTLLLVQFNSNLASRTFLDYESLALAMDGVCALYEKELKVLNPKVVNITYDISDLYSYLDQLADISLLVYVRTHLVAAIVFSLLFIISAATRLAIILFYSLAHMLYVSRARCYSLAATRSRSTRTCRGIATGSSSSCSSICRASRRGDAA